jgi:hypothetical protein
MSIWDTYEMRLGLNNKAIDNPQRNAVLNRTQNRMLRKIPSSLSYKQVEIDGQIRYLAIEKKTEDLNMKKIFALPGETLPHGSLLTWDDSTWLITELNFDNEFCSEGIMQRCNYLLKWIDDFGNLISRWCIVEDGTKYLIGEKTGDIMAIGDARIGITIGKDEDTNRLSRGKRFLIDDMDSEDVLAYQITKPNKLYNLYNGQGVFKFIMNEVNITDNDNKELRIADYYNWKPKTIRPTPDVKTDETLEHIVTNATEKQEAASSEDIKNRKEWL